MITKILSSSIVIVFATMLIGTQVQAEASSSKFSDVPSSHWASSSVDAAVQKGYVSGYPDGTFKPDKAVSRSEFIKMAVDALGIKTTSTVTSPWYTPFTEAAKKAGVLKDDYTAKQFNDALPRNEMAKVAVLGSGTQGYEKRVNTSGNPDKPDYRYEVASFDEAMYVAATVGLVQGTGKGKVDSTGVTTRAQAITIIERMLTLKNGGTLTPADELTTNNAEFAWHRTNMYTVMGLGAKDIDPNLTFGKKGFLLEDTKGKYKAELLKLTVVDLTQRNSDIYKQQTNLKNLKWSYSEKDRFKKFNILDYPDSYLYIFETKVHKNEYDNKNYPVGIVPRGFSTLNVEKQNEGELTGFAWVYNMTLKEPQKSSTQLAIVPKSRFRVEHTQYDYMSFSLSYMDGISVSLQTILVDFNPNTYKVK